MLCGLSATYTGNLPGSGQSVKRSDRSFHKCSTAQVGPTQSRLGLIFSRKVSFHYFRSLGRASPLANFLVLRVCIALRILVLISGAQRVTSEDFSLVRRSNFVAESCTPIHQRYRACVTT